MGGIALNITLDDMELRGALHALASVERSDALQPAWDAIGEDGVSKTILRFNGGYGPDGSPWVPSQRAKKTGGDTLKLSRRLMNSVQSNSVPNAAEWGTNVPYARIHQEGGVIDIFARGQQIYRRRNKRTGKLGNRFVKKERANFASNVEIKAYQITIPARPYLGIDEEDKREAAATLKTRIVAVMIDGARNYRGGGVR